MNNLVMIDSSCWIKYFRKSDEIVCAIVKNLINNDIACICGVIEMELVQGMRSQKQSSQLMDIFSILNYFDFDRNDFINAGNSIKELRLSGITVAISDTLIAELCIRNNLSLFTIDKDFDYFLKLEKYKVF